MRGMSLIGIGLLIIGLGCGTPGGGDSKPRRSSGSTTTVDGLVKTDIDMPGVLFIRDDHGIGSYDAMLIPPVEINYKRSGGKLSVSLEDEIRTMLRDSLVDATTAAGIPVLDTPGECVMHVGLALFNVDIERGSSSRTLGTMTLAMEFRDSMSGTPLLRYATLNEIENARGSRTHQLRKGFDDMISDLNIAKALRAAGLANDEVKPGCNGLMAKLGQATQQGVSTR